MVLNARDQLTPCWDGGVGVDQASDNTWDGVRKNQHKKHDEHGVTCILQTDLPALIDALRQVGDELMGNVVTNPENKADAKFCKKCGTLLEVIADYCTNCGERLDHDSEFCSKCGKKVK